eukprot:c15491_g1_i1.p1 GENE.c15491_g1_i1~~c15491_g1_i1.p1  ORF type:complete len:402 (-),score=45.18 c15491_g1_i1:59-1237(-)
MADHSDAASGQAPLRAIHPPSRTGAAAPDASAPRRPSSARVSPVPRPEDNRRRNSRSPSSTGVVAAAVTSTRAPTSRAIGPPAVVRRARGPAPSHGPVQYTMTHEPAARGTVPMPAPGFTRTVSSMTSSVRVRSGRQASLGDIAPDMDDQSLRPRGTSPREQLSPALPTRAYHPPHATSGMPASSPVPALTFEALLDYLSELPDELKAIVVESLKPADRAPLSAESSLSADRAAVLADPSPWRTADSAVGPSSSPEIAQVLAASSDGAAASSVPPSAAMPLYERPTAPDAEAMISPTASDGLSASPKRNGTAFFQIKGPRADVRPTLRAGRLLVSEHSSISMTPGPDLAKAYDIMSPKSQASARSAFTTPPTSRSSAGSGRNSPVIDRIAAQ